jgi:hypothetical protein
MRGYDVYCICRSLRGWSSPDLDTYLKSSEKPFFELLCDYLIRVRQCNVQTIKDFLRANVSRDPLTFDPFKLLEEEAWTVYQDWRKTLSTKGLYFEEVRKSFEFIENFCINNGVNFDQYKKQYAHKHIREKKIDYAVVVHLNLVDIKKLKKVHKIILQNFVSQYNIIKNRLSNPELSELLSDLTNGMNKMLQSYEAKSK